MRMKTMMVIKIIIRIRWCTKNKYTWWKKNEDDSSISGSSDSKDSFSSASKLHIYKETMQGPEVNPKFLSKIVKSDVLYNSAKATKPHDFSIPLMI